MADVQIDAEARVKFFEARLAQLQKAFLQMEVDIKSAEVQLEGLKALKQRAGDEINAANMHILRAKAEIDEKKRASIARA